MADEARQSWWTTLPGILTGLATALTAGATLVTALNSFLPSHTTSPPSTQTNTQPPSATPGLHGDPSPCAAGDLQGTPQSGLQCLKFNSPQVRIGNDAYPLDICLNFAHNCDKQLADYFCQHIGYRFAGQSKVGSVNKSYVILDKKFCEASPVQPCDSPDSIVCFR